MCNWEVLSLNSSGTMTTLQRFFRACSGSPDTLRYYLRLGQYQFFPSLSQYYCPLSILPLPYGEGGPSKARGRNPDRKSASSEA